MPAVSWRRQPCDTSACPEVTVLGSLIGVRDSARPGGQAFFSVADFLALLAGDWSAEIAAATAAAQAREVGDA